MAVLLGIWFSYRNQPGNLLNPAPVTTPAPVVPAEDLSNLSNPELVKRASDRLTPENSAKIAEAIALLMDRGDLNTAATILNQFSDNQLSERAALIYLKGRLHWQNVQLGNPDYNLETVRMSWESAQRLSPDNPQYYKAMGFLNYAEGDAQGALNAWSQALTRIPEASDQPANGERLELQAATALATNQLALLEPEKTDYYLQSADETYRLVIATDANSFAPEALAARWLWTKEAIADWQALGQAQ